MEIFEYESIIAKLDIKDIVHLHKFHSKHLNLNQINELEVELKANSFVGKIVLPSRNEILIKPKIKINNLLYIISYTYDLVNFNYTEKRKLIENESLIDVYIKVLLNWIENLFKKGLYKNYQNYTEELTTLRGKILINESITKKNKLFCEYHDISFSNEENKIIKATLLFIINQKHVEKIELERALIFYRLFKDIENIKLSKTCFKRINIHRLNSHYKPIIDLCELVFNNMRLADEFENNVFSSFLVNMNTIYEKFLLKALQKKLKNDHVDKSRKIDWAISEDHYLPQIEPDIYVKNKAIIDAKYYKSPFTNNGKFISGHIYQIITYLKAYNITTGFLVYPEPDNGKGIDSKYSIDGINFNIFSIPLDKEIEDIEEALNRLVEKITNSYIINI